MSDEYKVFRDLPPEADKKLKAWMKNPKQCFVCKSKDIVQLRGKIKCNGCGMIVIDNDHKLDPVGVM